MKTIRFFALLFVVSLVSVNFTSCGSDDDDSTDNVGGNIPSALYGTWNLTQDIGHGITQSYTYTFYPNNMGTYTLTSSKGRYDVASFTYQMNGNKIICTGYYVTSEEKSPMNRELIWTGSAIKDSYGDIYSKE